jgi:competence protein ComEC
LLLNTHPHGDHVGGFPAIVRSLHVAEVLDSGQSYGGRAFNDGLREGASRHVPVRIVRCGDRWSSDDGVTLSVLSPCGALVVDGKNDINENSVVAMLEYRGFRGLFTGDAGFEAEQRLVDRGVDLHADVLKVGHHGSAYSSSPQFLAAVRPRYALVSAGRHNLFGHPAPKTLLHVTSAGAEPYRTDICGAISVMISETISLTTQLPCSAR